MTWNVLQNANGDLIQQPSDEPIPEGWAVVVITANPEYLSEHFAAAEAATPEEP